MVERAGMHHNGRAESPMRHAQPRKNMLPMRPDRAVLETEKAISIDCSPLAPERVPPTRLSRRLRLTADPAGLDAPEVRR